MDDLLYVPDSISSRYELSGFFFMDGSMGLLTRLIPSWIPMLVLLVSLSGGTVLYFHKEAKINQLQTEISKLKEEAALEAIKQVETIRKVEQSLQEDAAVFRKETNDKVTAMSSERNRLLKRLRNYEARQSNTGMSESPSTTEAGEIASGDPLGEFLNQLGEEDVHEAVRAETIRLHLIQCYANYDRAEAALKGLNQQ